MPAGRLVCCPVPAPSRKEAITLVVVHLAIQANGLTRCRSPHQLNHAVRADRPLEGDRTRTRAAMKTVRARAGLDLRHVTQLPVARSETAAVRKGNTLDERSGRASYGLQPTLCASCGSRCDAVANRSRDCGDLDGFERFDAEAAAFARVQTG